MIFDSQIHVWEESRPDRPWPADGRSFGHRLDNPVSAEEAVRHMDRAGVDRAVLIPPSFEGDRNDVIAQAVRRYPSRFVAIGRLPTDVPLSPEELDAEIARHQLVGFRLTFNRQRIISQLEAGELDWLWTYCAGRAVPVMVLAPGHTEQLEDVARRYPDLLMAIDHCNLGEALDAQGMRAYAREFGRVARLPNVSVKVTALPCYIDAEEPFPIVREFVDVMLSSFGAERVFWGSDVSRLECSYESYVDFFVNGFGHLSKHEHRLLMGEALERWLLT